YNYRTIRDFTPIIRRLKYAQPDLVLASSYPADAVLMWRHMGEQGYTPPAIMGFTACFSDFTVANTFGEGANGVMSVDGNIFVDPKGLSETGAKLTEYFLAEYRKRVGKDIPTTHAAYSFTGSYMFLHDILSQVEDVSDPEQIM